MEIEKIKKNCTILLNIYEEGYTKNVDKLLKDNLEKIQDTDFYNFFKDITESEFPKLYKNIFIS